MLPDLLLAAPALLLLVALAWLYFLALAGCLPPRRKPLASPRFRFAILIPAHNEAARIGATLSVLRKLDYPAELVDIIVAADNCEDDTAEVVGRAGIQCFVRTDPVHRGKGNVLRWLFKRLADIREHDAYLILDADSHPETDFLLRLNHHFLEGAQVVQGYSQVRHPERSVMESLAFLGFALNRNLRYRGRARLGWTSNLLGTGMCFRRQVIERFGWNTTTMVEDIEYEMMLHLGGIRVCFADDARLSVELHHSVDQSRSQRTRWDLGKFEVRNRYLPGLLRAAVRRRDPGYLDSALELLLPPFSLFCVLVLGCCALYFGFFFHRYPDVAPLYFGLAVGLALYVFWGLLSARAERKVYLALLHAPFFMLWRLWIVVLEGRRGSKKRQW